VKPSLKQLSEALGWTLALVLALFLIWQAADGRMKVKPFAEVFGTSLESFPLGNAEVFGTSSDSIVGIAPLPGSPPRLMNDLVADLWTADRYPEKRFISSELVEGMPAIRVPADSRLEFTVDVPPKAQFRTGIMGIGQGELRAEVSVGADTVQVEEVTAVMDPGAQDITWIEIDLAPWSGQPISLNLATGSETDEAEVIGTSLDGLWIMPQIETASEWLLSDPLPPATEAEVFGTSIEAASFHFANVVELLGYNVMPSALKGGETARVTLYWRLLQESGDAEVLGTSYAKVFVHLIDDQGQLVAQHDTQPVNNAYPIPVWQPDTTIVDEHALDLPADLPGGVYTLAVGLYDPDSLERWPVTGPDGLNIPEGHVFLTTAVEVSP
jgi:hypothetical protein